MWKRCGSDKPQQSAAAGEGNRSQSGLSDRRQQTAAAARALQAGGRPFEPRTAHLRGSAFEARSRPFRPRNALLPPGAVEARMLSSARQPVAQAVCQQVRSVRGPSDALRGPGRTPEALGRDPDHRGPRRRGPLVLRLTYIG